MSMLDNPYRLPDEHRKLLRRYYCSFYRPLARGERIPTSDPQRHFVAVSQGRLPPHTPHEFAYTNFMKYCALSGISEEEAIRLDFRFPPPQVRARSRTEPASSLSPDYSGVPCPRCARKGIRSLLVWRHARDPSISGEFLGCSRYPHCQYKER
jgi:hypothetical protein